MKNLLSICVCFLFLFVGSTGFLNAASAEKLSDKISAKVLSKKDSVMTSNITVGIPLIRKDDTVRMVGCKAYVLDKHWLIMGSACLYPEIQRSEVAKDGFVMLQPEGKDGHWFSLAPNLSHQRNQQVFYNSNLILLSFRSPEGPAEYRQFYQHLADSPKVNLLAFKSQEKFQDFVLKKHTYYVNTSRFGSNTVVKRKAARISSNYLIKIRESRTDWASLSTDPLFVSTSRTYLVGTNQGTTLPSKKSYNPQSGGNLDWDGQPSKKFRFFSNKDVQFIKQTLLKKDPDAWTRVQERITVL